MFLLAVGKTANPVIVRRATAVTAVAIAAAVLLLQSGCAYFNTMYNARKLYGEAEKTPRAPDGSINRTAATNYDAVIEKCQTLILSYPDSKWVDDAILLMGKSYYAKGEYADAIQKFDELESNFPNSKLNEEGQLYLAKAYVEKQDPERAIVVLKNYLERWPKAKASDEVLFLLGTNSIRVGREPEAVQFLEILAYQHPKSEFRIEADLEIADLYVEKKEYEKSLAIYEKLADANLSTANRVRYLSKLSEAYVGMGRYKDALDVLGQLGRYPRDDKAKAHEMLVGGRAHAGMGSTAQAIDVYESVVASYPRSIFSAEAAFQLGVIYQEQLDSLDVAKRKFDLVPRQYAKSAYADEAIRRSASITKLVKLRASLGTGEGEGQASVQFDLAEIQLFQFQNYETAIAGYRKVIDEFPSSAMAPRAAYAIAYVYDAILQDPVRARNAYQFLVDRYPDSEQAAYARDYLELVGKP